MRSDQSIAAVKLVLPDFGRRRVRLRSLDGRLVLKRRAWVRAVSLWLRPINFAALALALIGMFAGESAAVAPYILLFGLFALVFERGAAEPKQRRPTRIVRDVRPLLLKPVIHIPEAKRAARIIRAQPASDIPALPPDRPRTRIAERRPGPFEDASD